MKKRSGEVFQGKMRALGLGRRRELLMKLVGSCGGEHVRGYTMVIVLMSRNVQCRWFGVRRKQAALSRRPVSSNSARS